MQPLGEFIRQLRVKAGVSLREMARNVDISAPFLSDIELGKRHPSEKTLLALARHLKTTVVELKRHDHRGSVAAIKRLIERNPRLGFALRTALDNFQRGKLTAEEFERRMKGD